MNHVLNVHNPMFTKATLMLTVKYMKKQKKHKAKDTIRTYTHIEFRSPWMRSFGLCGLLPFLVSLFIRFNDRVLFYFETLKRADE